MDMKTYTQKEVITLLRKAIRDVAIIQEYEPELTPMHILDIWMYNEGIDLETKLSLNEPISVRECQSLADQIELINDEAEKGDYEFFSDHIEH